MDASPEPFPLSELRALRRQHGLSQSALAKRAGVSQSLIAKIEAGRLDPTYSRAQQIFQAFHLLVQKHTLSLEEVMHRSIIFLVPQDTIAAAVQKMRKHAISQMPVVDEGHVVGMVSESSLLDALLGGRSNERIRKVMNTAPPLIPKETPLAAVTSLLRHLPVVLVADKGKLIGLVTKTDVLQAMVGKKKNI